MKARLTIRKTLVLGAAMLCGLGLRAGHLSDRLMFSARLNGANQVPAVMTDAVGVGAFTLNSTRDSICVNVSVAGLSGAITGAHLHQGAAGTNGSVALDLSPMIAGNRITGKVAIGAADIEMMMKTAYYLNIHTAANPNGEIRGQVKLETDWSHKAWLDGSYSNTGAQSYGLGVFNYSLDGRWIEIMVATHGLSGSINAAHFHSVATGGVLAGLDSLISGHMLMGYLDATALPADSLNGMVYLNLHTAAYPGGEIAGVPSIEKSALAFDATLDQSLNMTGSTAKGVAHMELNATMDTLFYHVVWDTLAGTFGGMHIHHSSGGVMYDFGPTTSGNMSIGFWAGVPDSAITDMLKAGSYINIHSTAFPAGEISGKTMRLAREGLNINLDGNQSSPTVMTGNSGGMVSIDRKGRNAHYMIAVSGLSGEIQSAHFHHGVAGTNGGVLYTLPFTNNGSFGYWHDGSMPAYTAANALQFRKDSVYVNVHTAMYPNGEQRGQVIWNSMCEQVLTSVASPEDFSAAASVFPNPTNGEAVLRVSDPNIRSFSFEVRDLTGRVVFSQANIGQNAGEQKIDLRSFPAGMYLVRLQTGNGQTATLRLVKE